MEKNTSDSSEDDSSSLSSPSPPRRNKKQQPRSTGNRRTTNTAPAKIIVKQVARPPSPPKNDIDYGKILSVRSVTLRWELNNFIRLSAGKRPGYYVKSPVLEGSWSLSLYPRCHNATVVPDKKLMSVFLNNERACDVTARASISILGKSDEKVQTIGVARGVVFKKSFFIGYVRNDLFTASSSSKANVDGKLILLCEIFEYEQPGEVLEKQEQIIKTAVPCASRIDELDYLEKLLESGTFADVTFVVEDKKIPAHKNILAARSAVFAAMLTNDTNKRRTKASNNESVLQIEDVRSEVFMELLRFVYAARVNNIENIAKELLLASESYSLGSLKTLCESTLIKGLTTNNVLEYVVFATTSNVTNLKSRAIQFIKLHSSEVATKENLKLLGQENLDLLCEITEEIGNPNKKPRLE